MKTNPFLSRKQLAGAVLVTTLSIAGCGTPLLPPMDFKVVDTKATPDELLQPSIDPIGAGTVKPSQPGPFVPVEITAPKADKLFGLTNSVDKGPWAKTQNTAQILVNGRRLVDANGTIRTWSPISNTGFITYLVKNDRVEQTPDGLSHYDLKMLDVRTPGQQAEVIATLASNGSRHLWRFGKDAQPQLAELYHLTSKGVVLMREDNSVITYFEAGKTPVTTALPVGYKATAFGVETDLAYGRHIRIIQHRGVHKLLGLLPSDKEELYDISFWNMERGEITGTAKDVVVNVATEDAFQNYINGASQMVDSASGPLVVSIEDTLKKTVARNLATLEKVVLVETPIKQGHGFQAGFETKRAGGIGEFHKVWVRFGIANGNLSNSQINDLEQWMKEKAPTVAQNQ
jgi:hypothetical protein